MRLERLADERARTQEKMDDLLKIAEEEKRDLGDFEQEQITKYREQVFALEEEIVALATDVERVESARDVSAVLRGDDGAAVPRPSEGGNVPVYRSFAQFARDELIVRYPEIAQLAAPTNGDVAAVRDQAVERLQRAIAHTTSSNIAGLVPPAHMAEIMDSSTARRPVVNSGRKVPLERGSFTYPEIAQRPAVLLQSTEKTEGGTANMQVTLTTVTAQTYIGGGNLSWQAMNWSTPDALAALVRPGGRGLRP